MLGGDDGLDDEILDPVPHRLLVDPVLRKVLPQRAQRPLVPLPLLRVLVGPVAVRVLVDRVVGEVHVDVGELGAVGGVLVGGEADEALLVEVDAERAERGHEHVNAEVVLGAVDQVRLGDVALDHEGALLRDLAPLVDHFDAVAAGELREKK